MGALGLAVTLVFLTIHHRVAFFALAALIVGAGIPLAFAWARVMPEDRPPFEVQAAAHPSTDMDVAHVPRCDPTRDPIAVTFLFCITIAYLVQFPGVPRGAMVDWLNMNFAESAVVWIIVGARVLVIMAGGWAVYYGILKSGPLRWPLISAAALVLILWQVAPLLRMALLAPS
jgi:hypothetical protein